MTRVSRTRCSVIDAAPQSRDHCFRHAAMGPGSAAHRTARAARCAASGARDPDLCYLGPMAKQKKNIAKRAKAGRFVIGRAGFGKISSVEGIQMTAAMKKR